jgi:hypothetical protein
MQFASSRVISSIAEQLVSLSRYVTTINQAGFYDINKGAEGFFCQLLNMIYGLQLRNMNEIQTNYPAIDLGDQVNKVCVQVTSESSASKLSATLKKFDEKNLSNNFSHLIFFVISDKSLPIPKSLAGVNVEILNVGSLIAFLSTSSDLKKLSEVDYFLRQNLKSSVAPTSTLLPTMIAPAKFHGSCNKLLASLGFGDEPESQLVIDDVMRLWETIEGLTPDERAFIYTLLKVGKDAERGSGFYGDRTFASITAVEQRLGGRQQAYELYQSLQQFGLVEVENEYQPVQDGPYVAVYSARFYGQSEVNILTAIRKFCAGNDNLLRAVILHCDFSGLC